jgi:hypothetical protein
MSDIKPLFYENKTSIFKPLKDIVFEIAQFRISVDIRETILVEKWDSVRRMIAGKSIKSQSLLFKEVSEYFISNKEACDFPTIVALLTKISCSFYNEDEKYYDLESFDKFLLHFQQNDITLNQKLRFDEILEKVIMIFNNNNFDYKKYIPNFDARFLSLYKIYITNHIGIYHKFCDFTLGEGLWLISSLINHSCDPNCEIAITGNKLHLISLRDIKKDEEITVSYVNEVFLNRMNHIRMRYVLATEYNFECHCNRCQELATGKYPSPFNKKKFQEEMYSQFDDKWARIFLKLLKNKSNTVNRSLNIVKHSILLWDKQEIKKYLIDNVNLFHYFMMNIMFNSFRLPKKVPDFLNSNFRKSFWFLTIEYEKVMRHSIYGSKDLSSKSIKEYHYRLVELNVAIIRLTILMWFARKGYNKNILLLQSSMVEFEKVVTLCKTLYNNEFIDLENLGIFHLPVMVFFQNHLEELAGELKIDTSKLISN